MTNSTSPCPRWRCCTATSTAPPLEMETHCGTAFFLPTNICLAVPHSTRRGRGHPRHDFVYNSGITAKAKRSGHQSANRAAEAAGPPPCKPRLGRVSVRAKQAAEKGISAACSLTRISLRQDGTQEKRPPSTGRAVTKYASIDESPFARPLPSDETPAPIHHESDADANRVQCRADLPLERDQRRNKGDPDQARDHDIFNEALPGVAVSVPQKPPKHLSLPKPTTRSMPCSTGLLSAINRE